MKCRFCGDTVRCAGCGGRALSSQARAYRKRKAKRICALCPKLLSKRDRLFDNVHCFDCRKIRAAQGRARYAKKGRKDRQRSAV